MGNEKYAVVKTYQNEAEAQLAQLKLESMGIDAQIHKDDCGGAFPQLQLTEGVQLVVNSGDVEKAEAILQEKKADESFDSKRTGDSEKSSGWGVLFTGVLAGALLSAIAFVILDNDGSMENGKFEMDLNEDGNPDEFHYYEDGMVIKIEADRNYDGKPDAWFYYEADRIVRSNSDDNFDGRVDGWIAYKDPNNYQAEYDTDFNGSSDVTCYCADGVKQRVDWHPGGSATVVRREIYKDAVKSKEYKDTDNDGDFDLELSFDAFGREVGRQAYTK